MPVDRNLAFKVLLILDIAPIRQIQSAYHNIKVIIREDFEDKSKDTVEDMLIQTAEEPINKELDKIAIEGPNDGNNDGDNDVKDLHKVKPLTLAKLSFLFNTIETMYKELQESHPLLEQSLKFKRAIKTANLPYIELLKDIR
ncbi:hypothetical protein chiPu_0004490 [Chiloscyllium punctatum]|uniref:Uncharacterized protein n=1 Tax=Chiloscyllium punctatum TaxID=137246 RepID=A0A401S6R4_CHIPU|nr:hypothetical protein [Chiloscyllium punctatum]